MIKFTYPLSSYIQTRKNARTNFDEFCNAYNVYPIQTKLREETYHQDIIFIDPSTNVPLTRRTRLYTMSFMLPQEEADRLLHNMASTTYRHYRQITPRSVLILRDDNIKVDNRY